MNKKRIYVEGGGEGRVWDGRVRAGFKSLLAKAGLPERNFEVVPCGSRQEAFERFEAAHQQGTYSYVALLVDSEDPVDDTEQPWAHLVKREPWRRPPNATDEQVFLMTTCMETWIVTDRTALEGHFGNKLQQNALPPLTELEVRDRHNVQDALTHASRNCTNSYRKNPESFELLGKLSPDILAQKLPAFVRMIRILREKL